MSRLSILLILTILLGAMVAPADMEDGGSGLWFPMGETLDYGINWGIISVGSAHVTTEWIAEGGRSLIAIRLRTKSNSFLSTIYPVDDFLEAIIDPETFLPVRFTKKLSEGRYRADETTTFDHKNLKAVWTSRRNGKVEEYTIDPDTRDIVTFMYFMRRKQFEPETVNKYRVMADDKVYDLVVKAQDVDMIKLDHFGKLPCLRFEPEAKFGGLFVRKGRMWMWVSQDKRRIATKISAQVPVASITLWLDQVSGPGDDFWVANAKKDSATSKVDK
jgi:hypothetical protein